MRVAELYPVVARSFQGFREECDGRYCSATCPIGNHSTARLRFWIGLDQKLVFGCWGGCAKVEILRAVGLKWADTFPDRQVPDRTHRDQTVYSYRDESRRVLYETVRLEPGYDGRDKAIFQRRPRSGVISPNPNRWDDYERSLGDVRRVLYRLPDLIAAGPDRLVVVVAGEKDVESLRQIGVLATTAVCGEQSQWLDSYSLTLAGHHVVVIEDADPVGARHANEVCGSVMATAGSLRRIRLPQKDATAYLNGLRRSGVGDVADLRGRLLSVIGQTRTWVAIS